MDAFENSLNELLVKVYRSLENLEETMLRASKKINLSISEIHLLEAVAASAGKEGATISDISEYLAISLPSVTLAVNKMQQKGYVERKRCEKDGRVVKVTLTTAGRRAEHAHRYFHRSMVRAVTSQLDGSEKQALLKGVGKLDAFLDDNIRKYKEQ